jgi:hypothetical protein
LENDLPMLSLLLMPRLIQKLILNSGPGLSPDAYILHTSQSMGNTHVALKIYEYDYLIIVSIIAACYHLLIQFK